MAVGVVLAPATLVVAPSSVGVVDVVDDVDGVVDVVDDVGGGQRGVSWQTHPTATQRRLHVPSPTTRSGPRAG